MQQFKNYKIIKTIMSGKEVFLARDIRDGKMVVIKSGGNAFYEFNILQKLNHPNIVKVYQFVEGKGGNSPYFVEEYIEGLDIKEYNKQNAPLTEERIKNVYFPLFNAINYILTKHNLVHNDLYNANVMIRKKDNTAILLDFGAAFQYTNYSKLKELLVKLSACCTGKTPPPPAPCMMSITF